MKDLSANPLQFITDWKTEIYKYAVAIDVEITDIEKLPYVGSLPTDLVEIRSLANEIRDRCLTISTLIDSVKARAAGHVDVGVSGDASVGAISATAASIVLCEASQPVTADQVQA